MGVPVARVGGMVYSIGGCTCGQGGSLQVGVPVVRVGGVVYSIGGCTCGQGGSLQVGGVPVVRVGAWSPGEEVRLS